jgi:hypothetical protein
MGISRFPIRPEIDLKNINSASPRCQRGHAVSNSRPDARAEHNGPMIFAQMGMLQAIHRDHKRVFNPDLKDTHRGKRKLKRDQ